ncbi:hypothetical protein D3C75_442870 [compost metagenome]
MVSGAVTTGSDGAVIGSCTVLAAGTSGVVLIGDEVGSLITGGSGVPAALLAARTSANFSNPERTAPPAAPSPNPKAPPIKALRRISSLLSCWFISPAATFCAVPANPSVIPPRTILFAVDGLTLGITLEIALVAFIAAPVFINLPAASYGAAFGPNPTGAPVGVINGVTTLLMMSDTLSAVAFPVESRCVTPELPAKELEIKRPTGLPKAR